MIDRKGITDRVTQTRLYCPAPWLKAGENEVIVFDLHKTEASPLRGVATRDQ